MLWLAKVVIWFFASALWCAMYAALFYVAYRLFIWLKNRKDDHDEKK